MYKSLLLNLSHFYSLLGHLLEETGRREEAKSSLPESGCGWVLWTIGSVPCASPSQHGQFHPNLRLAPAQRCPLWWCRGQPLSGTWGGVWGRQRWTGGWEERGKWGVKWWQLQLIKQSLAQRLRLWMAFWEQDAGNVVNKCKDFMNHYGIWPQVFCMLKSKK